MVLFILEPKNWGKIINGFSFKAGALYYSIFVSFLVALLTGLLLLRVWYHHYHTLLFLENQRLERNVKSSLVFATNVPNFIQFDEKIKYDLYEEDEEDEVILSKKQWGGFVILKSEGSFKKCHYSEMKLCGVDSYNGEPVALYLADNERSLSVCGKTFLNGTCYLPKAGIRRAYIDGTSFIGDKLVHGEIENSKSDLPQTNSKSVNVIMEYLLKTDFPRDSLLNIDMLVKSDTLSHSFNDKTLIFFSSKWIYLDGKKLEGNIMIVSSQGISIKSNTKISDIILYAPKIRVSPEFTGSVQLFARDSLIIGENTNFLFPSLIALLNTSIQKPLIEIGKNSHFSGDIFLLRSKASTGNLSECRLSEGCEVNGRIFCDGKLNLNGMVNGSVYCKSFLLQTRSSVYENHLLNAVIDFKSLSTYYSGSILLNNNLRYKSIKCLN